MKIRYFLSPNFLEKESILTELKSLLNKKGFKLTEKTVLDIGCGSKPYAEIFLKKGAIYKGIDFKQYSSNPSFILNQPDYFFPKDYSNHFRLTNLKKESFDIITSFQVLEHHANPEKFFSESKRLLKKNGMIIITFPFIWSLHEEPNDYQRLTHYKIKKIADSLNLKILYLHKRGGIFSVLSQLSNNALMESKLTNLIKKVLYLIFFLPLQYLFWGLEGLIPYDKNKKIFLGYFMILKKD